MPLPIGILPQTPTPFEETDQSIRGILQGLQQQRDAGALGRVTQDPEAASLYRLAGGDPASFQQLLALRNIASPNPNLTPEQIKEQRKLSARGSVFDSEARLIHKQGESDIKASSARTLQDITKTEPADVAKLSHTRSVGNTIDRLRQIVDDPESKVSQPVVSTLAKAFFEEGTPGYKAVTSARGRGAAFESLVKRLLVSSDLPKGTRLTQNVLNILGNAVPSFGNSRAGQQLILENLDLANQTQQNEILARRQAVEDYRQETGNPNAVPSDLRKRQEAIFNTLNKPVEDRFIESFPVISTYNDTIGRLKGKVSNDEADTIRDNIQSIVSSARNVIGTDNTNVLSATARVYRGLARTSRKNLDPALLPEGTRIGEPFIAKGKKYAVYNRLTPEGYRYVVEEFDE